jgi:hypothetical protein
MKREAFVGRVFLAWLLIALVSCVVTSRPALAGQSRRKVRLRRNKR